MKFVDEDDLYEALSEINLDDLLIEAEGLLANNDYNKANEILKEVINYNTAIFEVLENDPDGVNDIAEFISSPNLLNSVISKVCKYIPVVYMGYVYFGFYPQTLKETSISIVSTTPDNDGYYLGSDGERYAKAEVVNRGNFPKLFNDRETKFEIDETFYFKVEPIKWIIEEKNNNTYKLISDNAIDCCKFCVSLDNRIIDEETIYPNNYEYSEVRKWLNNEFLNKAFTRDLQRYINVTEVDNGLNSVSNRKCSKHQYICNNTFDKIYLPSVRELTNVNYGYVNACNEEFTIYIKRRKLATDYVKALGGDCFYRKDCTSWATYMTRSPRTTGPIHMNSVGEQGQIFKSIFNYDNKWQLECIVPSLSITIK